MQQVFCDRFRDARRAGMLAIISYWLHAFFDVLVNGIGERMAVAQRHSRKGRILQGMSFIVLVLSYPLLWYGILVMFAFYAEPTGYSSPAGTVQYYIARLVRIPI